MESITQEDMSGIASILQVILANDNVARKQAEEQLSAAKQTQTDKYACLLTMVISPESTYSLEVKSLAAVILRRNISTSAVDSQDVGNAQNNDNLWQRLSDSTRNAIRAQILATLDAATTTKSPITFTHKVCNVAVEIQGAMQEHEDANIWQDLLNLLFSFISSEISTKVDAALQIFNGLFSYIMEHLVKYKGDLCAIFEKTLQNEALDIKLSALQATSNYLSVAERKDTKEFIKLIPLMAQVVKAAHQEDDEQVLEDALVEFNELAEIEPGFFRAHFKEIYEQFKPIIGASDFANASIRHQPLEFATTMIERKPSLAKKDLDLIKDILENIFKLMIDIDEDIEQSWLQPKEGFAGEDEDEDNVQFGKDCVDRLVASVGDEVMLPLVGQLVQNTMANEEDWRYKHAGIMAFSQVGEYVDDIKSIGVMIPVLVQHLQHPNPKIRYAANHCIGQLAEDITEDFVKEFGAVVMPALIQGLDDSVPRVCSHTCACFSNFLEHATEEFLLPHMQILSQKLCMLIKNGISIVKENASTALATLVEKVGEKFLPYFTETLQFLTGFLTEFSAPEYQQFRGQVIEAITIICASVGVEAFKPVAADVINVMLQIQNNQLQAKDTQRVYLLSAWQRLCLLLKSDFEPFLHQVLPGVLSMATLNPSMGVSGQETLANLTDVLKEVSPDTSNKDDKETKTGMNVLTDELEEKDVAIQMLAVFIDEVGTGCYQYIEPISKILLHLTDYEANDSIRRSCADALPGLVAAAKKCNADATQLHAMGRAFTENLYKAMKKEFDTDTAIGQVTAFKEIIDHCGNDYMTQAEVEHIGDFSITIVEKSLKRIEENEKLKEEEPEDEDDQLDNEDLKMLQEESSNEHDLQLTAAELMGVLFKTHKQHCGKLVEVLKSTFVPQCLQSGVQKRFKFALFILDDMVEYLGPSYFSPQDFQQMVQIICQYSGHKSASLRQASSYGIGVVATNAGEYFHAHADLCLQSLKAAIDYSSQAAQAKKHKMNLWNHARDNAIASLGKVIKFQQAYVQQNPAQATQMMSYWLGLLPITHDVEEAQAQYEYLSEFLLTAPQFVLGGDPVTTAEQLAKIYGEAFQSKYFKEDSNQKQMQAQAVKYLMTSAPSPVPETFKKYCENVLASDTRKNIEDAFNFQS